MAATAAVPRRAFRRHTVRIGIAAIWMLPAAFFGVFALDLSPDGVPVPEGQRVIYGAIALFFLVLAVRTWRIGVFTRPDGVIVRNVLWTHRLRWEEIAAFAWGFWRGPGAYPCGVVRREDGRDITAFALNPPLELTVAQDARVPELLDELNEVLARARGWPHPPDADAPVTR
jgi:hypothetical protein